MWIMTTIGFFSVVEKPKNTMCIRARKMEDLQAFRKLFPESSTILKTPKADYRYRVFVSRADFEKNFYKLVQLINYSNFKDAVFKVNPKREKIYHKVWAVCYDIEFEDAPEQVTYESEEPSIVFEEEPQGE